MAGCLVVLMFAPVVTVVGYEVLGYRHHAEAVAVTRVRSVARGPRYQRMIDFDLDVV